MIVLDYRNRNQDRLSVGTRLNIESYLMSPEIKTDLSEKKESTFSKGDAKIPKYKPEGMEEKEEKSEKLGSGVPWYDRKKGGAAPKPKQDDLYMSDEDSGNLMSDLMSDLQLGEGDEEDMDGFLPSDILKYNIMR